MQFLSDLQIPAAIARESVSRTKCWKLKLNGLSVFEVLGLTVEEAAETFGNYPRPKERWRFSNGSVSAI